MDWKVYVVDEERMEIEQVSTLYEASVFFRPEEHGLQFKEDYSEDEKVDIEFDLCASLASLMSSMEAGSYNFAPGMFGLDNPLEVESLETVMKNVTYDNPVDCEHDRRHYQGFSERYDYCEKCGAKNI